MFGQLHWATCSIHVTRCVIRWCRGLMHLLIVMYHLTHRVVPWTSPNRTHRAVVDAEHCRQLTMNSQVSLFHSDLWQIKTMFLVVCKRRRFHSLEGASQVGVKIKSAVSSFCWPGCSGAPFSKPIYLCAQKMNPSGSALLAALR